MNFDIKTEQLSDDTYVISLAGEVDLYTAPDPSRIWSRTTSRIVASSKPCCRSGRNALSRFGPIVPLVPAAESVWHAPHCAVPVKSF